jgi:hypothetical protein
MMHKLLIAAFAAALLSCRTTRPPSLLTVTVDYILFDESDSSAEVWAKRRRMYNNPGYVWYVAKMKTVPDSIRVGKRLQLRSDSGRPCDCILFKQVNKTR